MGQMWSLPAKVRILIGALILLVGVQTTAASAGGTASTGLSAPNAIDLPDVSFFRVPANLDRGKKVFAHYMLCCGSFGETPEAYEKDIRLAQKMGLDGFALNIGGWRLNPAYKDRIAAMFAAAKNLSPNFKLFISADMCCGLNADDILDMMRLYANGPNYLRQAGRPVLSTYSGEGKGREFWQRDVLEPLDKMGLKPFFVPAFYSVTHSGRASDEVTFWDSIVDGLFYFAPAQTPFGKSSSVIETNLSYARALKAANKLFLAGYYPFYWGSEQTNSGRRYYEYEGGKGTAAQWESIIKAQDPSWVEITTWNDFAESYLVAPQDDRTGLYKPHTAFMELNRYYIAWFKTGVQPEITKDAVFYFYRTHPMDLRTADDPLGPVTELHGNVKDEIYVTVALTAPAALRIDSGGIQTTFPLDKGISHVSVPFHIGSQQFRLSRHSQLVGQIAGEPVQSKISVYNFYYTTGFFESAH
jgi:glucan endo-1,3-alpha-glucosidase